MDACIPRRRRGQACGISAGLPESRNLFPPPEAGETEITTFCGIPARPAGRSAYRNHTE